MDKGNSSRLYTCPLCERIYQQPYTMNSCGHVFCKECIERIILFSIIKPNYDMVNDCNLDSSNSAIVCPLCNRVTDLPNGDFTKDLQYNYEFELHIR